LGLPLLEAQYGGLPVIAPNKAVFREVLGESGLFMDPSDPSDAAARIASAFMRPDWRGDARESALANLARWKSLANRDHVEVLRLLARLAGIGNAPC